MSMERLRAALAKITWPRPPAEPPNVAVTFYWPSRPATREEPAEYGESEHDDLTLSEAIDLIASWTDEENDPQGVLSFTVWINDNGFEDDAGLHRLEDLIDQFAA